MALEATFRELHTRLMNLQDNLLALRLTVAEDKPLKGEAALVDHFEDSILDTMGLLDECLNSSRAAQKAVGLPLNLDQARRALTTCQNRFHLAAQELVVARIGRDQCALERSQRARDGRGADLSVSCFEQFAVSGVG